MITLVLRGKVEVGKLVRALLLSVVRRAAASDQHGSLPEMQTIGSHPKPRIRICFLRRSIPSIRVFANSLSLGRDAVSVEKEGALNLMPVARERWFLLCEVWESGS